MHIIGFGYFGFIYGKDCTWECFSLRPRCFWFSLGKWYLDECSDWFQLKKNSVKKNECSDWSNWHFFGLVYAQVIICFLYVEFTVHVLCKHNECCTRSVYLSQNSAFIMRIFVKTTERWFFCMITGLHKKYIDIWLSSVCLCFFCRGKFISLIH